MSLPSSDLHVSGLHAPDLHASNLHASDLHASDLHASVSLCRKEEYEDSYDKAAEAQLKYEEGHLGDFTRIYPVEDSDKYEKYFQHSGSLFQETAASKARGECAR